MGIKQLYFRCALSRRPEHPQRLGSKPTPAVSPRLPAFEPDHLYLHLRNNQDYPFSNIFLVVNLKAKDSLILSDTLEYAMAQPNGEWLGTGFSSVKESKLWWKEQWSTAVDPPYTVEIAQANRTNGRAQGEAVLPGIVSVGLSITSAEN